MAWSVLPCLTAVLVFLGGPSDRPVVGWFSSKALSHGLCLRSRLSKNLSSLLNLQVSVGVKLISMFSHCFCHL